MLSFFNPENINSMVDAILRLYKDTSLRDRQVKKAKAFLDKYGWENHQLDLIHIYRDLK